MRSILLITAACCLAALVAQTPVIGDEKPFVGPPAPPEQLKIVRTLGPNKRPGPFAFSPDGRVVAMSEEKRVRFWDTASGKEIHDAWETEPSRRGGGGNIMFLAFVGPKLVAFSFAPDVVVHLRSYPDGKEVATLDLNKDPTGCLTTAIGLVATGSSRDVRVWSNSGGHWAKQWQIEIPVGEFAKNPDAPRSLAFSPDRSELAVGTNHYVYVHRVKDGKLLHEADRKQLRVSTPKVAYSPDGRELTVASGWASNIEKVPYALNFWDTELKVSRARSVWSSRGTGGEQAYRCFFTPDGKTLILPCADNTVRIYEVQTARLRHIGRMPDTFRASLSPDGRLLAARRQQGDEWELCLCDWRAARKPMPLNAAALDSLWESLASPDSMKGFRAVVALGAAPTQATQLIGDNLKSVSVPNAQSVKSWIAELGSEDFAEREAAEKELAKLGDAVEEELKQAAKSDAQERRDRANRLLKAISKRDNPERLQILRAVEILEYINTPASRDVLKTLASGASSALLTRDAKAALTRLQTLERKP